MVCPSFVLGGDANTGSADFVCLETELLDGDSDSMPRCLPRLRLLRCWAYPRSSQWFALVQRRFSWVERMISMPRCLLRSPSVLAVLSGGMLCCAAFSGFLRRFGVPAAMLFWAALSDGYGGYACFVEFFGVFVWSCDADCSFGCGEHSALHFVRDGAGGVLRRLESRRIVAKGGRLAGLTVVRVLQEPCVLLGFFGSYMVCQRRTMPPSSVTWGRMEVMTSPPLRVTNLKPVFVVRI